MIQQINNPTSKKIVLCYTHLFLYFTLLGVEIFVAIVTATNLDRSV